MLTTVLFDMGGTLEDIWYNEDTQRATCRRLLEVLRANGLEPGCPDDVFWKRITDGVKAYKQWSEGNMLEKKPEEIWPDWYLRDFAFDREKLLPITEELANLWEVTFYHRELRDGAAEILQALKSRGYHLGVISNNASLYNVFRVLEDYGIRGFMEDVTVSSVTGYRKPDPEIYLKAAEALRLRPEECVVFEDARAGIEAGDRAGMKVVALATTLSREELERTAATLVIDDFTQMSVERLRSL